MISKCSIYLSLFCILFIFCVTDSKYDEYHILERNVKIGPNFIPFKYNIYNTFFFLID